MGRSGSSSKKKYLKKKSLKVSSEARRKKRSKRNKSKKIHRHDDSYSSCSDDDSTSSSLVSSSSSEGEYKSRKSRSRTRKEVKGSKKRTRRRSCSEDSTNDSPPVKKRKRSKKKGDYEKKKNKKKIKKSRRDDYTSSSSSDSASCSTRGDGDSSDKDTIKGKTGNRKNRSRRRRSSSPNNGYDDDNIENVMVENNPRRLKSVITIATQPENEEGDDMKRDELKEEMVYDYDYDYPSCKSNDSNDGETKKELVDDVPVISKEKDNASDNLESGVDDLESILRQKALENLSRFRGGIQTKTVVPVDSKQKNDQSGITVNHVQTPVTQPVVQKSRFTWRRDASVSNGKDEKTATYSGPESSRSPAPAPKLQSAGLSSTDRVDNKITNETSKNMTNTHESTGGLGTNEVKKSTAIHETPSSGSTKDGSSKEQQTETNENSQFEKKTMSVMRGGEMVQVSYKVYIPNRAPALARRQLKR